MFVLTKLLARVSIIFLNQRFVDSQPNERLAQVSLQYLRNEKEVAKLMKALDESDILDSEKGRIRKLLEAGGARTALMF